MRLQMRGVDHDPFRLAALARQFGEDPVEHAQAAPANEPIVDLLVRPILGRRVAPTQSVPDHKDDRAHNPTIVNPRDPMRKREIPFNPTHLRLDSKNNQPWRSLLASPMNQPIPRSARTLIGPEPRISY